MLLGKNMNGGFCKDCKDVAPKPSRVGTSKIGQVRGRFGAKGLENWAWVEDEGHLGFVA